jgi:hypothetical protein
MYNKMVFPRVMRIVINTINTSEVPEYPISPLTLYLLYSRASSTGSLRGDRLALLLDSSTTRVRETPAIG